MLLSLTGCGLGEFFATLGFDTHDYEGEKIIEVHKTDSDIALELCDMVSILTVNSADIPEFKGTTEGIECCRDAVLNSMYNRNFAKYAGNSELFKEAMEMYPQMDFSVLIPADDFENVAYKYFGGKEKITNESGEIYEYIEDIDAYITVAKPVGSGMEVTVLSVEETEKTFRMEFETSLKGEKAGKYFALFIKRDDDSIYFRYVKKI